MMMMEVMVFRPRCDLCYVINPQLAWFEGIIFLNDNLTGNFFG